MARMAATMAWAMLVCAGDAAARDLQDVLNTGTLRVGVTLFAPWAERGADGELVGFEVDVAQQLAADMGVKAQLLAYDVDRLVPALEAGEIDLIAAGLTITPERALHVNFSQPYAESGIALATHLARTADVTDVGALDNESSRSRPSKAPSACSSRGACGRARGCRRSRPSRPRATPCSPAKCTATSRTSPCRRSLALENPGVIDVPMARPLLASRAGFAVNKGDPDFLAFLNAWITAREADTWLPTTTSYWFKSLRWQERLADAARR